MTFAQATQFLALRDYVVTQGKATDRYFVRNPQGKACFHSGQSAASVIALAQFVKESESDAR